MKPGVSSLACEKRTKVVRRAHNEQVQVNSFKIHVGKLLYIDTVALTLDKTTIVSASLLWTTSQFCLAQFLKSMQDSFFFLQHLFYLGPPGAPSEAA